MPVSGINSLSNASTDRQIANPSAMMDTQQFLQLLATELSNQNPMEPLSSSEFLGQMSQINNLQMINSLSDTIKTMLMRESIFQAGSLLDRMVEYTDAGGKLALGLVQDVRLDSEGNVKLGLSDGKEIEIGTIRRVLVPPETAAATTAA